MPRQYKQYLRDISVPIPESTQRYRTSPWPKKRSLTAITTTTTTRKRRSPDQPEGGFVQRTRGENSYSEVTVPIGNTIDSDDEEEGDVGQCLPDTSFNHEAAYTGTSTNANTSLMEDPPIHEEVLEEDPVLDFREHDGPSPEKDSEDSDDIHTESQSPPRHQKSDRDNIPLHDGTDVTRGQFLLLILSYILRHKLSGLALSDLLQLLNLVMPGCLPKSKYLLEKLFKSAWNYEQHHYCPNCNNYFGTSLPEACDVCGEMPPPKSETFFLVMPLAKQVKDLAVNHGLFDKICSRGDCSHENIHDVCCGELYQRRPIKKLLSKEDNISLTWSCDGVPVFSSSKYSIWPIVATVNELPYHLRRDHVLLYALWFGKTKPHMSCYLQPFVDELTVLSKQGVDWVDRNGMPHNTKVVAGVCACDTPARALLQNFTQFNGHHGCSFCVHEGKEVPKGNGRVRIYPLSETVPVARTDETTQKHAEKATKDGAASCGVKGPSVLMLIPHFDIVDSFSPEYMHAVLLGVVRQVVALWIDTCHHGEPYYLGQKKLEELNQRLLSIKPPKEIRRQPRSLTERKYWKASEWRHFLMIYSGVVLRDILPKSFYQHWLLLVNGISLLMGTCITPGELETADLCLLKFVAQMPELYGIEHLSFNVHLLTHLRTAVENQGPLWSTSAFVFEDAYGKLQNLSHGTQHVPQQMFKAFFASRELSLLAGLYLPDARQDVISMFHSLSSTISILKKSNKMGDFVGLGTPALRRLTVTERLAIEETVGTRIEDRMCTFYNRFVLNGKLFTTERYAASFKRDDSVVEVAGQRKKVCAIQGAVVVKTPCACAEECSCVSMFLLVQPRTVKAIHCFDSYVGINLSSFIHAVDGDTPGPLTACKPDSVTGKFVTLNEKYLVKLPMFELD